MNLIMFINIRFELLLPLGIEIKSLLLFSNLIKIINYSITIQYRNQGLQKGIPNRNFKYKVDREAKGSKLDEQKLLSKLNKIRF